MGLQSSGWGCRVRGGGAVLGVALLGYGWGIGVRSGDALWVGLRSKWWDCWVRVGLQG